MSSNGFRAAVVAFPAIGERKMMFVPSKATTRSSFRRMVLGTLSAATFSALLVVPGTAAAISDGQSPSTCGSPVTAYAATARDLYGNIAGFVDLRFSSACPGSPSRATWARVSNSNGITCSPGIQGCGSATVIRNGSNVSTCFMASGSGSCFTWAAADIGSSIAKATGNAEGTVFGGSATTASLSY